MTIGKSKVIRYILQLDIIFTKLLNNRLGVELRNLVVRVLVNYGLLCERSRIPPLLLKSNTMLPPIPGRVQEYVPQGHQPWEKFVVARTRCGA